MSKTLIAIALLTAACGHKADAPEPSASPSAGSACPLPKPVDVSDRFAVGVTADYRVNGMGEAAHCHDVFVANSAVGADGKTLAEGTFQGHCPNEDSTRTFQAVKAAKVIVSVDSTHTELGGELGAGKPVILGKDHLDWLVSVTATPADRCGDALSVGISRDLAKWTAGADCANVAKLVPWTGDLATSDAMQIAPLGAGSCTVTVTQLGVTGSVAVTVK